MNFLLSLRKTDKKLYHKALKDFVRMIKDDRELRMIFKKYYNVL